MKRPLLSKFSKKNLDYLTIETEMKLVQNGRFPTKYDLWSNDIYFVQSLLKNTPLRPNRNFFIWKIFNIPITYDRILSIYPELLNKIKTFETQLVLNKIWLKIEWYWLFFQNFLKKLDRLLWLNWNFFRMENFQHITLHSIS